MHANDQFTPRLDILPLPQQTLWPELSTVPSEFVLYGGTAIALHLGHRESVDFDFFGDRTFDATQLASRISFMADATITQREPSTLTATVDRGGVVKVSFFGVPDIRQIAPPRMAADNGLKVASLLDLGGTKASVVQMRAEAKDYIDIDALMTTGKIDLPKMLAAGRAIYGPQFTPESTLKALCFFDDGNLRQLPEALKERLTTAVRAVDLDRLPDIDSQSRAPKREAEIER
jgi:nucleotidyltransferase AbiEii toxin of type IV toxin-antitoxin system